MSWAKKMHDYAQSLAVFNFYQKFIPSLILLFRLYTDHDEKICKFSMSLPGSISRNPETGEIIQKIEKENQKILNKCLFENISSQIHEIVC